ncbi:MAG: amidase [Gammaproteobacteria bacterium]|nr:amidase [Gammaproteobacteria bacterium]
MNQDIIYLSAIELLDLYRSGQASPVEVTQAVIDRVERLNPAVNAFCWLDADAALKAARASETRWQGGAPIGILDGVPATIKDLILTKGWPTRRGSLLIDPDQEWPDDAPAVARLREQGAVIIGKTTTPEFGWKGVTDSALTGVTRNPWNTALTPGGSSGGAAAACALGMGALHIGTDGGGSVRIPAGFTGIFGHKPSFGRVPAWPLSPFGTVAHLGPMTRTVADAALMLTVLSAPDARDWHALPATGYDYRNGLDAGVRGLRIGFSPNLGYVTVDDEVAAAVSDAVAVFTDLGAHVEEIAPPFENPLSIFQTYWYSGAANLLRQFSAEQRQRIDPGLQEVAAAGNSFTLPDFQDAERMRAELGVRMNQFHGDYDLLLTPALPIPAFTAGHEIVSPSAQTRWSDWTPFTYPFNLTQQPACSIPCGFTGSGLPVGLQIVGPMFEDGLVLTAARAFESVHPVVLPQTAMPELPGD